MKVQLRFLSVFITLLVNVQLQAQEPAISWQNNLGGNGFDDAWELTQTTDGGYVAVGYSSSDISGDKTEAPIANFEYWVVKVDASGIKQWDRTLGGDGLDNAATVVATQDGGVLVGGISTSNASATKSEGNIGFRDYWVVKLDTNGVIVWDNTIGATQNDFLWSIVSTADGGALLAGSSRSPADNDKSDPQIGEYDYWIVKINAAGAVVWDNTIGGASFDELRAVKQTSDGGFILGGFSQSNISGDKTENSRGGNDYWVVKTDATGEVEWDKTLGGSSRDEAYTVVQTLDGGYVVGGFSNSNSSIDKTEDNLGQFDSWLVKLSDKGAIVWDNTYGGTFDDGVSSLIIESNGNLIAGNFSESNISGDKNENSNGGLDYWLVTLDSNNGTIINQSTIGGAVIDRLVDVVRDGESGYAMLGSSFSNISGDKNEDSQGSSDYWIVKLDSFLNTQEFEFGGLSLYPNPVHHVLNINLPQIESSSYIIYNILGQTVLQGDLALNNMINVTGLESGLYVIQINTNGNTVAKRFIKD